MSRALSLVADTDALSNLRRLQPKRSVTLPEARSIAERQATDLLVLLHVGEPPVPQFVIASLPGIRVDWRGGWPTAAASFYAGRYWQIVVRAEDNRRRQRFSLAHEFKHVLDDPVVTLLFHHLTEEQRHDRIEGLCNYFAACLLMPRPWIKHDYCGGLQRVRALADRYYVSEEAMTTRLSELGLVGKVQGGDGHFSRQEAA